MKLTRRDFLKVSGAAAAGMGLSRLGFDLSPLECHAATLKIKGAKEAKHVCCYCSVGCGQISHVSDGKLINFEGDPDHPISRGALCAKGASAYQLHANQNRLAKVRYRAPYGGEWKEVSWDWAMERIARNVKKSRDAGFIERNDKGEMVNRTEGIASAGSAALDNEECFVFKKFLRGLGLVWIEHQARI